MSWPYSKRVFATCHEAMVVISPDRYSVGFALSLACGEFYHLVDSTASETGVTISLL
jgi:hypothetical protein